MPYSLKDIGDRLAALEALGLSNRLATLEASQSGGGGSGVIAAISMGYPVNPGKTVHVFFYTTQETTLNFPNMYALFIAPGYTMYIRVGGSSYSYIGRITAYDSELPDLAGKNFTYYFTKN